VLIGGALVLNELRSGLVNARIDSLTTQGELIANVIDQAATVGEPEPAWSPTRPATSCRACSSRARSARGCSTPRATSWPIPTGRRPGGVGRPAAGPQARQAKPGLPFPHQAQAARAAARKALATEIAQAKLGEPHLRGHPRRGRRAGGVGLDPDPARARGPGRPDPGSRRRRRQIIAAERKALLPFILVAIAVTVISVPAQPPDRPAGAAHGQRRRPRAAGRRPGHLAARHLRRKDELGDLSRALEEMTDSMSERMDAIERFAADVAHEIKNPLTSIRSADRDPGPGHRPRRPRPAAGVLQNDVKRLDRLVTDISNASRLDAELSRDAPKRLRYGAAAGEVVPSTRPSCARASRQRRPSTPPAPAWRCRAARPRSARCSAT
jgi:two-component system sensor histidine kinase ChvG